MSNQKEKYDILRRLECAGIRGEDANKLRKIARTLHRWHELECGVDSGGIERDAVTGKVKWYYSTTGTSCPYPDKETGALKRLEALMKPYSRQFRAYVQTDPRGAAIYLVRHKDVPKGGNIDAYYSKGIAVY